MTNTKKENWFKKIFNSSWFFVLTLVLLFVFSFALINAMAQKVEIKKEIANLEEKIKNTEEKNTELSSLITYFKTEDYVIKEAKTKLGLKNPGENVVAVINDNSEIIQNDNGQNIKKQNWQLWRDYFFNKNK